MQNVSLKMNVGEARLFPGSLTSPLKISHQERKLIFQPSFFRGSFQLWGCNMIELDRRNKSRFNGFSDFTLEFAKDFYFSKRSEKWPTKMELFFQGCNSVYWNPGRVKTYAVFSKEKWQDPPRIYWVWPLPETVVHEGL